MERYWFLRLAPWVMTGQLIPGGARKLILGAYWVDGISAYELGSDIPIFSVPVVNLGIMRSQDINSDGIDEIMYADAQDSGVHVLDASGQQLNRLESPWGGISNVLVCHRCQRIWRKGACQGSFFHRRLRA